jgi:hypothetical protein
LRKRNPELPDVAQRLAAYGINASTDGDIDQAFATLLQRGAGALVIGSDVFYASRLDRLAALTQRHRVPATYFRREFPDAGGLLATSITRGNAGWENQHQWAGSRAVHPLRSMVLAISSARSGVRG